MTNDFARNENKIERFEMCKPRMRWKLLWIELCLVYLR